MAIQAVRALRGTKTLTQAFFNAADSIALERRPAVVKAALSSIRDELKTAREKAKLAKSKVASPVKKPAVVKKAAPKAGRERTWLPSGESWMAISLGHNKALEIVGSARQTQEYILKRVVSCPRPSSPPFCKTLRA